MKEFPHHLYNKSEKWSMEHIKKGVYQTSKPYLLVGKIGTSYPPKKKYTYDELIKTGWKDKHYDCNVCRTNPCSCKYCYE